MLKRKKKKKEKIKDEDLRIYIGDIIREDIPANYETHFIDESELKDPEKIEKKK